MTIIIDTHYPLEENIRDLAISWWKNCPTIDNWELKFCAEYPRIWIEGDIADERYSIYGADLTGNNVVKTHVGVFRLGNRIK